MQRFQRWERGVLWVWMVYDVVHAYVHIEVIIVGTITENIRPHKYSDQLVSVSNSYRNIPSAQWKRRRATQRHKAKPRFPAK